MSLEASKDGAPEGGVQFIHDEDTGQVTAKDLEAEVTSCGEDRLEALKMLIEALELYYGGGEDIEDPREYLENLGVDPSNLDKEDSPPWL